MSKPSSGNPMWQVRVSPDLDLKLTKVAELMSLGKPEIIRFAVAQYVGAITGSMDKFENMLNHQVAPESKHFAKQITVDEMIRKGIEKAKQEHGDLPDFVG